MQAVVIPIADRHLEYAESVKEQLKGADFRVEVDSKGERMNQKIRTAQMQKIPYMLGVFQVPLGPAQLPGVAPAVC